MALRTLAVFVSLAAATPMVNATILNLTTAGSSATGTAAIGGTFQVQQIDPQSTGTGVIDSFLRIQQNGQERGFNTDVGTPLDDLGGNFTRSLQLSEIPTVTIGGVTYYQFLLDINQIGATLLSLNQIQIFQSSSDLGTGFNAGSQLSDATSTNEAIISFASATEVFRMSTQSVSTGNEIQLNYDLNPGSGAGDMFLYVRADAFTGAGTYVTLFSQFGAPPGAYQSNDGFEEWAVLKGTTVTTTPEPASIVFLGSILLGVGCLRLRRKSA